MAKIIAMKLGEDYTLKLLRMERLSEDIVKKAIDAGADIVANEVRANLNANLAGSTQSTGALSKALGITPISQDKNGFWNAKVGFGGYDEKGVPNQLKARVMESGSSKVQKRPFVRPAVIATKKAAQDAMQKVVGEELEKIMKG